MKNKWITLIWICLLGTQNLISQHFPSQQWDQYENIQEAGFSAEDINRVKEKYDSSEAASLLVIQHGKVVLSLGDNTRRFMVHSVRKGFMNALIGIHVGNGLLNPESNLKDLEIDDKDQLTETEKMATVYDLLSAKSGVYLPSAYSPKGMEKNLPPRGSQNPGEFWYYNNWDFNTLCTILEEKTDNTTFEEFKIKISDPLMMEDYRIMDGHYRLEPEKSIHPAYLFKMSARDMARFGLLYLNNGNWAGEQIVPKDWVQKSTSVVTEDLGRFSIKGSYGYLWWISDGVNGQKMYYASGSGGHRIMVLPESDMVIVHRVNTYEGKNVGEKEIQELVRMILNAKVKKASKNPKLKGYQAEKKPYEVTKMVGKNLDKYVGDFLHPFLGIFSIIKTGAGLTMKSGAGNTDLFQVGENRFIPEDIETPMVFKPAENEESRYKVSPVFGEGRELKEVIFYY